MTVHGVPASVAARRLGVWMILLVLLAGLWAAVWLLGYVMAGGR